MSGVSRSSVIDILDGVRVRWLVTGVAGFIGSNLLEYLLKADQEVVGLDNFATRASAESGRSHAVGVAAPVVTLPLRSGRH